MSISRIELQGTVARAQDFTTIKQNEENKAGLDQSNFQSQFQEEVKQKTQNVSEGEKADNRQKKFDAKEKGSNQYQGDGGHDKKNKPENQGDRVVLKGQSSFDIKI